MAFDLKEPTFRHEMYEAYKGTQKTHAGGAAPAGAADEGGADSHGRADRGALPGYEADDIIGTLAKTKRGAGALEVSVVSGDRDLLQLADGHITDPDSQDQHGAARRSRTITPEDVKRAQYQVTPIAVHRC